ncbi:ROK family glucokinase [Niallia sp. Krafla_26]|uniref:ROK family glucokinase n=1 Tax=Niallia sp. Krafla_26 TaxID=3064703 RepID=UPI003D175F0D
MKRLLGIDLGGTTAKFAILTLEGEIQQKWSIKTDVTNDGKNIIPNIIESILQNLNVYGLSSNDVLGIGMGSPGAVDSKKGTVIGAYNLGWKTMQPVKDQIEAATGLPFFIDNDANVAALGERWKGAGEGEDNVIFVTLGTGVGGGVIVEGNLIHGAGAAGELGHINVDPNGYLCTCGNRGCLETVASATGVVRLALDFSKSDSEESEIKRLVDDGKEVTAKIVFDLAKQGDPLALKVVDQFSIYLGVACANMASILNPESIVIGGGVSAAGEILRENVEKYFLQYAFPPVKTSTKLKLAQLGNDAGVIGAAWLVKANYI